MTNEQLIFFLKKFPAYSKSEVVFDFINQNEYEDFFAIIKNYKSHANNDDNINSVFEHVIDFAEACGIEGDLNCEDRKIIKTILIVIYKLNRSNNYQIELHHKMGIPIGINLDETIIKHFYHEAEKEIFLAALRDSGYNLKDARDELKADKDVVLAAVDIAGTALEFASDELKADKEVVLAAVKNKGIALKYASNELKGG